MREKPQRKRWGARDAVFTGGMAVALVALSFYIAYQFVEPAPPSTIVMATGEAGGAYQRFGERFAAHLANEGIVVELYPTAGSVENLALLDDGSVVDVGFVQSGLNDIVPTTNVTSLGSMYLEPLWLFVSTDTAITDITDLAGSRVAIGAEGSGTRALVLKLLGDHGIDRTAIDDLDFPADSLAIAFANNEVDAAFFIGAPESRTVARLVEMDTVRLQSFAYVDAYTRRYSYLSKATLPMGVVDLAKNLPSDNVNTIALTAMLVGNKELHPALVDLLLIAATDIHGRHSLLSDADTFPTARFVDLPLSQEAERFFRFGPPFLMRYLPFWAATLVDRLWVMLLPLIGLAIPLFKLIPPIYHWRIRRRILRLYTDLEEIDPAGNQLADEGDQTVRLDKLNELEHKALIIEVPKDSMDAVYKLRRDIDLVRRRLTTASLT